MEKLYYIRALEIKTGKTCLVVGDNGKPVKFDLSNARRWARKFSAFRAYTYKIERAD